MIERYIGDHILNFMEDNNLFNPTQYGFRPNRCTGEAIFEYLLRIMQHFEQNRFSIAIHLDLRKAFDTICHTRLVNKLKHYYFSDPLIKWLDNYLTNRRTIVMFNGNNSLEHKITVGVPQGSVLGPILFLLYINDLPNLKLKSYISLYADDTLLLHSSNNLIDLTNSLQEDLHNVGHWMEENKLSVNATKSEIIPYGQKTISQSLMLNLSLNGTLLKVVDSVKFLGIIFDNSLNFTKHSLKLRKTINDKNYIFKKNKIFMDERTSTNTVKVMINPYLDYANIVFLGISEHLITPIQTSFNNSMRIASRTKKSDRVKISLLLNQFDLLNFKEKTILSLLRIMKRKVDRTRLIFDDGKLFEYNEYFDGGCKIIKIYSRHLANQQKGKGEERGSDGSSTAAKNNEINAEVRDDVNFWFSQGRIHIRRDWDCPLKITRGMLGYTMHSFTSKKSRIMNSCAILGPNLWNSLPDKLRNSKMNKDDFTSEIKNLLTNNYFKNQLTFMTGVKREV